MMIRFATSGDAAMAIGNAVERDHFVYVYDEKGHHLTTLFAGNGPEDGLKGYTSTTVNVRLGACVHHDRMLVKIFG
jgi:hypothetical protein